MPYTPTLAAYLTSMEHPMTYYHVVDPAINASHGSVWANDETHAKDRVVSKFGWGSYAEYVAATAKHSGTRTLEATEIGTWK